MDYKKHYDVLVDRAKNRILSGYFERHHIIPRCLGGTNDAENVVSLTAEEHFVAHQLLVKMYPKNIRLLWALSAMTHSTRNMSRVGNKRYGWLRKRFSAAMHQRFAGKPLSEEHRAKLSVAAKKRKSRPHSEEAKAKMSAAAKGKPKSSQHIEKMRAAKIGKKRKPHSKETKRRMAESQQVAVKTRDQSFLKNPEYRRQQSERMKLVWAERRAAKQKE